VDVHLQLTAPSSIETQPQETPEFEAILAIFVMQHKSYISIILSLTYLYD